MTTKATLYLDSDLYKAIKLRAVESGQSVSALMNDALKAQLSEDLDDINSIRYRLALNETPITFKDALEKLQANGQL
jgi:plasmid stability protein